MRFYNFDSLLKIFKKTGNFTDYDIYQILVDPQKSANERNSSRKWRKTVKAVVYDNDLDLE